MISARPLPNEAKPKPERVPKRTRVTIAAGILCSDGIVLCADSEETLGTFKRHRPKLVEMQLVNPDLKAVVVGSTDDAAFMDALLEKISEAVDRTDGTRASTKQAIEDSVEGYCRQIWSLYPTVEGRPTADLLIGLKTVDDLTLIAVQTPIVRDVATCEFIGWGYELASYKGKQLLLCEMPVEITAGLAAHLMDVVKQNSKYCGGDTRMAVIHPDGRVEHKSKEFVDGWARGYQALMIGVETFLMPVLATIMTADGKNLIAVVSDTKGELEVTQEDKQKLRSVVQTLVKAKDKMIAIQNSAELKDLAGVTSSLFAAITAAKNLATNLTTAKLLSDEDNAKAQAAYTAASELQLKAQVALSHLDEEQVVSIVRSATACLYGDGSVVLSPEPIREKPVTQSSVLQKSVVSPDEGTNTPT